MMKIPLGLDIVPVNGWQARLNRQGRDLIIEEENDQKIFHLDENAGKAEGLHAPHGGVSVRKEKEGRMLI